MLLMMVYSANIEGENNNIDIQENQFLLANGSLNKVYCSSCQSVFQDNKDFLDQLGSGKKPICNICDEQNNRRLS